MRQKENRRDQQTIAKEYHEQMVFDLKRAHLQFITLLTMSQGSKYADEIKSDIFKYTHGKFDIDKNNLYKKLRTLEDDGMIISYLSPSEKGAQRKYYDLTSFGKELLGYACDFLTPLMELLLENVKAYQNNTTMCNAHLEISSDLEATFQTLKEYYNYADSSSLSQWNKSYVHTVLKSFEYDLQVFDEAIVSIFKMENPEKPVAVCYSMLPTNDIDDGWTERITGNICNNNLKWGIVTNGHKWHIYRNDGKDRCKKHFEIDMDYVFKNRDMFGFKKFYDFMK